MPVQLPLVALFTLHHGGYEHPVDNEQLNEPRWVTLDGVSLEGRAVCLTRQWSRALNPHHGPNYLIWNQGDQGGFATVLLSLSSRDQLGNRKCSVIKVYHGDTNADAAQHLEREAFFIQRISKNQEPSVIRETFWDAQEPPLSLPPNGIRLEYAPISLSDILQSPPDLQCWQTLARSFALQLCKGLDLLHRLGIAHRDINPQNLMVGWSGHLKIIDFGSACFVGPSNPEVTDGHGDFEQSDPRESLSVLETAERGNMDYQVGTGAYRAPELLFASTTYDALAVDTWAMGGVIAAFFSQAMDAKMGLQSADQDSIDMTSLSLADRIGGPRTRASLFDATFGDLGLAASIFRLRGVPSAETWPEFSSLPDAGKFEFDVEPEPLEIGVPLLNRLDDEYKSLAFDLLDSVLCLRPSQRMSPAAACEHAWFRGSDKVSLSNNNYPFRGDPLAEQAKWLGQPSGAGSSGVEESPQRNIEQVLEPHYTRAKNELNELSRAMDGLDYKLGYMPSGDDQD